jgi:hypothetical protein
MKTMRRGREREREKERERERERTQWWKRHFFLAVERLSPHHPCHTENEIGSRFVTVQVVSTHSSLLFSSHAAMPAP